LKRDNKQYTEKGAESILLQRRIEKTKDKKKRKERAATGSRRWNRDSSGIPST